MNLTRNLKQTCVYWAPLADDGFGGSTFDDPIEIECRWSLKQQLFIDSAGEERLSDSVIYLSQDVALGGYLYLGDLNDLDSTVISPDDVADSKRIRQFLKIPDLKAVGYLRKAFL